MLSPEVVWRLKYEGTRHFTPGPNISFTKALLARAAHQLVLCSPRGSGSTYSTYVAWIDLNTNVVVRCRTIEWRFKVFDVSPRGGLVGVRTYFDGEEVVEYSANSDDADWVIQSSKRMDSRACRVQALTCCQYTGTLVSAETTLGFARQRAVSLCYGKEWRRVVAGTCACLCCLDGGELVVSVVRTRYHKHVLQLRASSSGDVLRILDLFPDVWQSDNYAAVPCDGDTAVLVAVADDVVKVSLVDGAEVERYPIPVVSSAKLTLLPGGSLLSCVEHGVQVFGSLVLRKAWLTCVLPFARHN